MEERKRYGLVLAGGGAKGAYQIGALKALNELGVLSEIGPVAGTSIGGINLALYASVDVEKSSEIWKNFTCADFLQLDDNGFDISKQGDGIFSRDALIKILKDNVDFSKITNAKYDYFITVCEKNTSGQNECSYIRLNGMSEDVIIQYLMATSAIPIVYDAVKIDGHMYFDGGLKDNTPIRAIYNQDIDEIIVISNDNERSLDAGKDTFSQKKIINIVPSASLSIPVNALSGTADLISEHEEYRLKLGYLDTKAIMGAYLSGLPIPDMSGNKDVALNEYKRVHLERKVKSTFDDLDDMLNRHGIK